MTDKAGEFCMGLKNFSHPLFDKHEKSREHMNVAWATTNKEATQEEICSCSLAHWRNKLNEE